MGKERQKNIRQIDDKTFEQVKAKAEAEYKQLTSVNCPYFGELINFNAQGLDHIKFKRWNKTRTRSDQYIRLKLLHLAPQVIQKSNTLQGFSETKEFERKKISSRWDKVLTPVSYYEFVAILEEVRVRVIVRCVEGGQKHFWSIIPFWKAGTNNNRKMFYGKPPED